MPVNNAEAICTSVSPFAHIGRHDYRGVMKG